MNLIAYLYRQSWQRLLLAAVIGTITGLCGAAMVAVINEAIGGTGHLAALGAAFFGLCLLQLLGRIGAATAMLHLTQDTIFRLRIDLSRKLLATPQKKLQELGRHGLLAILTQDIGTLTQACQELVVVFTNTIIIAGCLAYLMWLSWQLLAAFALCLLLGMYVFHLAEHRSLRHLAVAREQIDALYKHFRGLIEGSKELQLNAQRGRTFIDQVVAPSALNLKHSLIRGLRGYVVVINAGMMLYFIGLGLLLFLAPQWVKQPAEVMSGIVIALLFMNEPVGEVMRMLPTLRQAGIALTRIEQLDAAVSSIEPVPAAANPFSGSLLTGGFLRLDLKGVCHRYPGKDEDSHFMLGPIDLTIHPGEILFIVGGNGSGKTTLAMVLLGLYEPEAGSIALNGTAVIDANREHYRQHFSAVFSDFHLFEHMFGNDRSSLQTETEHYLKALDMAHKVKIRDGRLSTVDLSSGQRKRLALVSAYLEDRPIYLFDEWAADQDPVFKRVFYAELLPELQARGKTVIVITHDDAYFSHADRIIKLEDGQLRSSAIQPGTGIQAATSI